jgi:hypothetical protein
LPTAPLSLTQAIAIAERLNAGSRTASIIRLEGGKERNDEQCPDAERDET